MRVPYRTYVGKLSIPGKSNDELTYTFYESSLEYNHVPLTLFGVFSIKSISEQYQLFISETVKNFLNYYRGIAESTHGTLKQDGINSQEFIFENAIQYTNERVTNALLEAQNEQKKIQGIDIRKIHFIIGVLCEGQLYASVTGHGIHALYFYPVYQKHGFSHYAKVDVIKGKDSGEQHVSSRLFSSIVSGSVSIPKSVLTLCNHSFLEYISPEQLKQAVTGNPIEVVGSYFQQLLGKIHAKNDFCALFLDAHYTPSSGVIRRQQTASNESMAVLNSKEAGTEKILFPAFVAQIKKIIFLFWKVMLFCARTVFHATRRQIPVFIQTLKNIFARRTLSKTNHAPIVPKNIPLQILAKGKWFIKKITKFFQNGATMLRTRFTLFSTLPNTSKPLLFISVIFLLLFGASILIIQRKNTEQKQQRARASILANAEEKNNLAEASLLYDNTEKARALLSEAHQLLRDFPSDTKNQEQYKKIIKRMQLITEKINHVTPLKNMTALADLAPSTQNAHQLHLAASGDSILLYSASEAYVVDFLNGAVIPIQTQTKIPSISCGIALAKTNFYLCDTEARRIYSLDVVSGSIQPIPISLAKEETAINTLAVYNQRIYIFTASQGIVFRHAKTKDGFASGIPIIKNIPVTAPQQDTSLTIDGSIFMLQSDEQILKYTSGKKELFILPILDPRVTHIQKIWTDSDIPALYIFEPSQKRILAVDKKTRALKVQFTSNTLDGARDFAIVPEKKLLLVLNGTTLYTSPIDTK